MFNQGVPTFYNPKYEAPNREEIFLLKRRIRLMEKLHALKPGYCWYEQQKRRIERLLRETEAKLGIKP